MRERTLINPDPIVEPRGHDVKECFTRQCTATEWCRRVIEIDAFVGVHRRSKIVSGLIFAQSLMPH